MISWSLYYHISVFIFFLDSCKLFCFFTVYFIIVVMVLVIVILHFADFAGSD